MDQNFNYNKAQYKKDTSFKKGDIVLVLGVVTGVAEYDNDIHVEFKAGKNVSLPQSWVDRDDVFNVNRANMPLNKLLTVLRIIFKRQR